MENSEIIGKIEENPIIAAVRQQLDFEAALESSVTTIFLLNEDILTVKGLVERIKAKDKNVLVNVDSRKTFEKGREAIDYICDTIRPDGIITSESNNIKYAKEKGMFSILRLSLVDSLSYETAVNTALSDKPDMIEILPGIIPRVLKQYCSEVNIPVIAGGLIDSKEDIVNIIKAGALGAAAGKKELWEL